MVSIATLLAISPPPPLNRPRLLVEFLAALPLKPEGWTWETVTATEVGRDLVATYTSMPFQMASYATIAARVAATSPRLAASRVSASLGRGLFTNAISFVLPMGVINLHSVSSVRGASLM